jgi:uncharacterized protein affecting Mg2+/Co2+ transport
MTIACGPTHVPHEPAAGASLLRQRVQQRLCSKASAHRSLALLLLAWLTLIGSGAAQAQGWYDSGWTYRKPITLDRTQVSGGPHANFPVLVSLASDADLAARAQGSGNDILFTAADGTTKLDHEIERYTGAGGALVAWVRIPSLSSAADTVIYMYYGNVGAGSQQNASGVWSGGYEAVWHLHNNNLMDSTASARHATNTGTVDAAAQIAHGRDFSYSGNTKLDTGVWSVSGSQLTVQTWVKFTSFSTQHGRIIAKQHSTNTGNQDHVFMLRAVDLSGTYRLRTIIKTGTDDAAGILALSASSGNLTTGVWYLAAVTYDGANIQLFLNGTQVGSTAKTGSLRENDWPVTLGNTPGRAYPLDGVLDEARVSAVARSGDWLRTEYNNQSAPSDFHGVGSEQAAHDAQFVSQSVPGTMMAGQTYSVSVTLKNTGTATWTSGQEYRLGSQNAQNNTTWGLSRVNLPASIAPGENATFTFDVTAPTTAGTYNFQWRMLLETVEWFGDFTTNVAVTVHPAVASFNVVEPGAHAVNGKIFTKIAGQDFALDIVALDASNAVATGFTGTMAVEVVDATSGGACSGLPLIAALTDQTFVGGDAGRKALSAPNTVTNVFRNARVRVKFPTSSPTVIACSGDNFAIRPNLLIFSATDQNETTAGTARALNVVEVTATPRHVAGHPFQITAAAYNGAGTPAITTNYDGTPTAVLSQCAGSACTATFGTLVLGTWNASAGTVTTTTAYYRNAGSFNLQLEDTTFASVDAADGTPLAQRTISSAPVAVGRFRAGRFTAGAVSIKPRRDLAACASSFSYLGEPFEITFTVTAQATQPSTTTMTLYEGALARLDLHDPAVFRFAAIDGTTTPLSSRLAVLQTSGTWVSGVATVTAVLALQRGAVPDGPFHTLRLGVNPDDGDNVWISSGQRNLDTTLDGNNDVRLIGTTAVRFGRLRLQNAAGAPQVALPLPIEAQYWNGTAFVRNTDDHCTSIAAGNVALGNFQRSLTAAHTSASVGGAFNAGLGSLTLSAPGAANRGSVDVSVNLSGAAAGASCVAGMPASSASGQTYLQGAWCGGGYDRDPTARASFGALRAPEKVIYRRENF